MQREQRPNSGALFKNDRKQSDNHPDYRGELNVNGELFYVSAWIKTGAKGKFMSLAVKRQGEAQGSDPGPRRDHREYDGDTPF